MINKNEFDYVHDFDTSSGWAFDWHGEEITKESFYPFVEEDNGRYWYFKGNEDKADIVTHDEYVWDPEQPYFEYHENTDEEPTAVKTWDEEHPLNVTRYLAPNASFVQLTNTVETVVIDNIPPELVSDDGTEYLYLKAASKGRGRKCKVSVFDKAGLDFKQFAIFFSAVPTDEEIAEAYQHRAVPGDAPENWCYMFSRKYGGLLYNKDLIDPSSLHIRSNGEDLYQVEFELKFGLSKEETDKLNNEGLYIVVWDKSGNKNVYTLGKCAYEREEDAIGHTFIYIESAEDIVDLQPLQIEFFDLDPENMILPPNTSGSVWCKIFNPNVDYRVFDIFEQLDDFSIGQIDKSTIDESKYLSEGVVIFKIINIEKHGQVTVEAWLKSGISMIDETLRATTYAKATIGPWIVQDPEGRLYDIQRYVPTYLRNTDFNEFIKFFELYLNTIYTDLSKGTNISILEKIARINDFNDIDRIEADMINHYAKCFGAEFGITFEDVMNLVGGAFTTKTTDEDTITVLRYILKNLPHYNQVKGTEKGMLMALKMLTLSCRVINLWCKTSPAIEHNPDLLSEDELTTFANYYMTSRFDVSFGDDSEQQISFSTFAKNASTLAKLISSVKPITKILNYIKYIITSKHELAIIHTASLSNHNATAKTYTQPFGELSEFRDTEAKNYFMHMLEKTKYDDAQHKLIKLWIPYYTHHTDDIICKNMYENVVRRFKNSNGKFLLKASHAELSFSYKLEGSEKSFSDIVTIGEFMKEFSLSDVNVEVLDSGCYIIPKTAKVATELYDIKERMRTDINRPEIKAYFDTQHIQLNTVKEFKLDSRCLQLENVYDYANGTMYYYARPKQ